MTKNLNWQILTKNLVTFKRYDGVKDETLILWEFTKFLGRRATKNQDIGGIA